VRALVARERPGVRVLDFCAGRGRNTAALRAAGFEVVAVSDEAADRDGALLESAGSIDAVVSTHGLLHGTLDAIAARLVRLAQCLRGSGTLYATFGSVDDARFGRGTRIAAATFAPLDGDERGVAHTYFTRLEIETLLFAHFAIDCLEERRVDDVAGKWAHAERPLSNAVHWFAIAHRPVST